MDLVSRLCFSGDTPPDEAVVQKLMGYVTCRPKLLERFERLRGDGSQQTVTKKLMLIGDSIDPTPVVRSFLLQLLLRSQLVPHSICQIFALFVIINLLAYELCCFFVK